MPQRYTYRRCQAYTAPPKRQPRRMWPFVVAALLPIIVGIVLAVGSEAQSATKVSSVVSRLFTNPGKPTIRQASSSGVINQIINSDPSDQIGVAIDNINTRALTTYGVTTPFVAASTEKVLSAAIYYHLAEMGVLSLNDQLGAYSASFQLREMINQSDNDSWQLINQAIGGDDELASYVATVGIQYDPADNTMRAQDMAEILAKLYEGQLINSADTAQLLGYMQHTNDETMLPAVTPSNLTLYHKYGELDGSLHDTAIVTDGKNVYAIVIYTNGSSAVSQRTAIIQNIAKEALAQCGW